MDRLQKRIPVDFRISRDLLLMEPAQIIASAVIQTVRNCHIQIEEAVLVVRKALILLGRLKQNINVKILKMFLEFLIPLIENITPEAEDTDLLSVFRILGYIDEFIRIRKERVAVIHLVENLQHLLVQSSTSGKLKYPVEHVHGECNQQQI